MASTAISGQGCIVQIGTGSGGAKTITGVSQALPGVVTSTAHGFNNGDRVAIASVVGMTQLNGNSYTVQYKTANTFALANTDTTGFTAYSSAGTATPTTLTALGNAKTFSGLDGTSTIMDVTNFASVGKEYLAGLYDGGSCTFDLDIDNADAGQIAARVAQQTSVIKAFKIILPAGATPNITFNAYVTKFTMVGGVDKPLTGQIVLKISGGYTLA